jgi:hypothetical protein
MPKNASDSEFWSLFLSSAGCGFGPTDAAGFSSTDHLQKGGERESRRPHGGTRITQSFRTFVGRTEVEVARANFTEGVSSAYRQSRITDNIRVPA